MKKLSILLISLLVAISFGTVTAFAEDIVVTAPEKNEKKAPDIQLMTEADRPEVRLFEAMDKSIYVGTYWQGEVLHVIPVPARIDDLNNAIANAIKIRNVNMPKIVIDSINSLVSSTEPVYSMADRKNAHAYLVENMETLKIEAVGYTADKLVVYMIAGASEDDKKKVMEMSPVKAIKFKEGGLFVDNLPTEAKAPDEIIVFVPEGSEQATPIDEYENAKANVILEYTQSLPEVGTDLSTINKVFENADVVVMGTVNSVGLSYYSRNKWFPYTEVKVTCQQVLKGKADNELAFSLMGGYVPAAKYVENAKQRQGGGKASFNFTNEQLANGYVHVRMSNSLELQKGKQYVMFLSRSEDGSLTTLDTEYAILYVDGKVYKDFEGKTQSFAFANNTLPHELAQESSEPFNITAHGKYELTAKESVKMGINWSGNGKYLVLLTKQNYSNDEVSELAQSGILPIGAFENGVKQELAEKFKGIQMLQAVSSSNEMKNSLTIPNTATYYLYTISEADCHEINGTITVGSKQVSLKG